jgi:hypothetical protein
VDPRGGSGFYGIKPLILGRPVRSPFAVPIEQSKGLWSNTLFPLFEASVTESKNRRQDFCVHTINTGRSKIEET